MAKKVFDAKATASFQPTAATESFDAGVETNNFKLVLTLTTLLQATFTRWQYDHGGMF